MLFEPTGLLRNVDAVEQAVPCGRLHTVEHVTFKSVRILIGLGLDQRFQLLPQQKQSLIGLFTFQLLKDSQTMALRQLAMFSTCSTSKQTCGSARMSRTFIPSSVCP